MIRNLVEIFLMDSCPHSPKEDSVVVSNRKIDATSNVKLFLIDNALVGSYYRTRVSFFWA